MRRTPPHSPPAILLCYLRHADPALVHVRWTRHVQTFSKSFTDGSTDPGATQFPVELHLMQLLIDQKRQASRWMLTVIQEY